MAIIEKENNNRVIGLMERKGWSGVGEKKG